MNKNHPKNYGLALHTTTGQLGLAIDNFTGEIRSQSWDLGRDVSTYLHQYLSEFIKPQNWTEISFIAVAKGPGGFTGTRIGVVTARTLGQQLDIPVFSISSLAAVVWQQKEQLNSDRVASPSEKAIAIQMQARRGQLFVAIYKIAPNNLSLIEILPDTTMTPEAWQQTLTNHETNYQLIQAPNELGNTTAALLELAYIQWQQGKRPHWSEALPFYGQNPVE